MTANRHQRRAARKRGALIVGYGHLSPRDPNYGLPIKCYVCRATHSGSGVARIEGQSTIHVALCEACLASDADGKPWFENSSAHRSGIQVKINTLAPRRTTPRTTLGRPAPFGLLAVLVDFDLSINEVAIDCAKAHTQLCRDRFHREILPGERHADTDKGHHPCRALAAIRLSDPRPRGGA